MAKKKPTAADEATQAAETIKAVAAAKPRYFMIAETKALADAEAAAEWGWTKKGAGWIDNDGNTVAFLADSAAITAAISKGNIRLYEGYRWYATTPPHHLDAFKKTGAVEIVKAHAKPVIE